MPAIGGAGRHAQGGRPRSRSRRRRGPTLPLPPRGAGARSRSRRPGWPSTIRPMKNARALPRHEVIPVLDFGGQTAQLICRRVRDAGAFSLLVRPAIPAAELRAMNPKGIILSGGPMSVYEENAPKCDPAIYDLDVPVLGICYGMQLACLQLGGKVESWDRREFGRANLHITDRSDLINSIPEKTTLWMSHWDQVTDPGGLFQTIASTPTCPNAAVRLSADRARGRRFFGVQFHPEVTHTPHGVDILQNFLYQVCGCTKSWKMADFAETACQRVREQVGSGRVICGLSGGVDSSVVAALIHKAIGDRLTCVFVDTGLLRKSERELVETTFRDHFAIDLRVVDAEKEFLGDLKGVTEPQEKRRRIGHRFIEVFKREAQAIRLQKS